MFTSSSQVYMVLDYMVDSQKEATNLVFRERTRIWSREANEERNAPHPHHLNRKGQHRPAASILCSALDVPKAWDSADSMTAGSACDTNLGKAGSTATITLTPTLALLQAAAGICLFYSLAQSQHSEVFQA